jgi:hypothetical protein
MKILSLLALLWLGGGFAVYHSLPLWALVFYGFLSIVYLTAWLIARRGFYTVE